MSDTQTPTGLQAVPLYVRLLLVLAAVVVPVFMFFWNQVPPSAPDETGPVSAAASSERHSGEPEPPAEKWPARPTPPGTSTSDSPNPALRIESTTLSHVENLTVEIETQLAVLSGAATERELRDALVRLRMLLRDTALPDGVRRAALDTLAPMTDHQSHLVAELAAGILADEVARNEKTWQSPPDHSAAPLSPALQASADITANGTVYTQEQYDRLVEQLTYEARPADRRLALDRLSLMGGDAVLAVYEIALRDPDASVRLAAVQKLVARGNRGADDYGNLLLQQAANDPDERVAGLARAELTETFPDVSDDPPSNTR